MKVIGLKAGQAFSSHCDNNDAEDAALLEVIRMDDTDIRIIKTINSLSPKSFISPVRVDELLRLNETELGNRLMALKRSGHIDILTSDYVSSTTLSNSISKVCLTELGRQSLKEKKEDVATPAE